MADGFKWAALSFAVAGVGLAIAGCFFPPLELAAGASFEAALAASASTAFVAADASMVVGIGLDTAVAEVHPTPANQAVVVGDAVGVALGYGIGKALGALASKYGPQVAEIFAQRAAQKATQEALPELAATFRQATFEEYAASVEDFGAGANPELAQQSYQLYKDQKWAELEQLFNEHKLNGGYPPNDGFISSRLTTLEPHPLDPTLPVFDRFGGYYKEGVFKDGGKFVAKPEVPFEQRALHESILKEKEQHWYSVLKPVQDVQEGEAIPWFGQPGKGIQYKTKASIDNLMSDGFIKRVK